MAFDFGLRQIGVAVGNCVLGTTRSLRVQPARDGQPDWDAVSALVAEWSPDLLLVGDPLNSADVGIDTYAGRNIYRSNRFSDFFCDIRQNGDCNPLR